MGSTQTQLKEFLNSVQLPSCVCVCILVYVYLLIDECVFVCAVCVSPVPAGRWAEFHQQVKPLCSQLAQT